MTYYLCKRVEKCIVVTVNYTNAHIGSCPQFNEVMCHHHGCGACGTILPAASQDIFMLASRILYKEMSRVDIYFPSTKGYHAITKRRVEIGPGISTHAP